MELFGGWMGGRRGMGQYGLNDRQRMVSRQTERNHRRYGERVSINGILVHPNPSSGHGTRYAYQAFGCRCEECLSVGRVENPKKRGPKPGSRLGVKLGYRVEIPSYNLMHVRIRRERGPANKFMCIAHCGRAAEHWAYTHQDPNELVGDNGYPYSADVMQYQAMCKWCHAFKDDR